MKLHYFQGNIPNFGDDLNPFIFENLLSELFKREDDLNFYGIGSILDNRVPEKDKNIIFGTGVRGIQVNYPSKNWDVRFVRGPISAKALQCDYIADAAYCLPLLPKSLFNVQPQVKKYKYSFVPYFRHIENTLLINSFEDNGIHIISPVAPLRQVIDEIAASEFVICGAMHGAIVADILRVPWVRFVYGVHGYESRFVSELKWADWMMSISLDPTKLLEGYPPNISSKKVLNVINNSLYKHSLTSYIKQHYSKQQLFQLSADSIVNSIVDRLSQEVDALKKKYS
jgi:succinoglycan biosynthesis protein ExoV